MSLIVWFVAAVAAVGTAFVVVTQRNPFVSAIALLGNLASLATLYLLLRADFVAAAQVIVYAGAVMVMFLFVIAYVGPRTESGAGHTPRWQTRAAVLAGILILANIVLAITKAKLDDPAAVKDGFGSTQTIGYGLLTSYTLGFEVVSLLLLVGAIAGVIFGSGPRPTRVRPGEGVGDESPEADARRIAVGAARRAASAELLAGAAPVAGASPVGGRALPSAGSSARRERSS
jgi:NADH-quinone oxidoreductase subunit J